jgi:hypothetical protein
MDMFSTTLSRLGRLALLIALFALSVIVPAAAAQDDGQTVELIGMIEAMSRNSITVNQREVNIELLYDARLRPERDQLAAPLAALQSMFRGLSDAASLRSPQFATILPVG